MIQMTYDIPSKHQNMRVPMLDIEVWINNDDDDKIYYKFFQKQMRNPLTNLKSSALSKNQKMNILTQETFRRIHNTKDELRGKN